MWKRVVVATVVALASAGVAGAQSTTTGQAPPASAPAQPAPSAAVPGDTRPATTTINGDTGLWYVPTGEVLPQKRWSGSAYLVNDDYNQGFTDVSNFPLTFAFGLKDRAEVFGAWSLVRRIDRDVRPIFVPTQQKAGGVAIDYPFAAKGWSGSQLGDFWV